MNRMIVALLFTLLASNAMAQFTGPSVTERPSTVAEAHQAIPGTYVTVTGHIVARLREDYYTFRDATGEIHVEIEAPVWRNRQIGPETKVRLFAEVDLGITGRYLWVESLEVVD